MNDNSFFSKKVRTLLIAAVAVAVILAVLSTISGFSTNGVAETLLSPARSLASAAARSIERYYNYAFNYENLEAENTLLKEKLTEVEEEIREIDSLQRENNRLKALLDLSDEHEDYTLVPAYIISWESGNWNSSFTISKGTANGIDVGTCAVTEYGEVVGLVTDVGEHWAEVTTIFDTSLEISASIASSGYTGVVEGSYRAGEESNLRLNYLSTDAVLKNGDQVVTTGSTVYPKDLVVGTVIDAGIDDTGVSKYALLESSVDFSALEEIFLITDFERIYATPDTSSSDTSAAATTTTAAAAGAEQ